MKKNSFRLASSILACAIASTGFAATAGAPQMPPTIINVAPATTINFAPVIDAVGSLSAYQGTTLSAEADGRITQIYFKSGEIVKKGQLLVQIFPNVLEATLHQQQAQLSADNATYQRDTRLVKIGAVSKDTYDINRSKVQQDQANIESTQAQLTQRYIKAPFDGKVGLRTINVGQYLQAGDALLDLQQINPLYVDFSVPGNDIAHIKIGNSVNITSDAYPDKNFPGKVYATGSAIDSSTRMLNVRATIDNSQHLLMPGGFVEVSMNLGAKHPVVVIPETAIVYAEKGPYVFVLSPQHTAIKTNIVLGERLDNNEVIVTKGIKAGDQVINGGQMKLSNGAPAITSAEAAAYFAKENSAKTEKK